MAKIPEAYFTKIQADPWKRWAREAFDLIGQGASGYAAVMVALCALGGIADWMLDPTQAETSILIQSLRLSLAMLVYSILVATVNFVLCPPDRSVDGFDKGRFHIFCVVACVLIGLLGALSGAITTLSGFEPASSSFLQELAFVTGGIIAAAGLCFCPWQMTNVGPARSLRDISMCISVLGFNNIPATKIRAAVALVCIVVSSLPPAWPIQLTSAVLVLGILLGESVVFEDVFLRGRSASNT